MRIFCLLLIRYGQVMEQFEAAVAHTPFGDIWRQMLPGIRAASLFMEVARGKLDSLPSKLFRRLVYNLYNIDDYCI